MGLRITGICVRTIPLYRQEHLQLLLVFPMMRRFSLQCPYCRLRYHYYKWYKLHLDAKHPQLPISLLDVREPLGPQSIQATGDDLEAFGNALFPQLPKIIATSKIQ